MKITKFNSRYFKYLFPQRTRLKTEYGLSLESSSDDINKALTSMMLKDYDMIKEFLPENVSKTLDIGCGVGLIDIALYHHYNRNIKLYLLDKTNDIDENTSIRGFNKEYVFYNSMNSTIDTLTSNGVDLFDIFEYEVSEDNINILKTEKYDVIISLLSCGWHYSIETYIDLIKNTLSPDGVLILDIRHNTDQLQYALDNFKLIAHIINHAESKHTGGTIGDRYIFKLKS